MAILSAGCGGGGGPTPVTVTITGTPALVGIVTAGGAVFTDALTIGDLVSAGMPPVEEGWRGFVSFDLSSIPAGATVLSATLQVFQMGFFRGPYDTLGDLVVDQIVYSPALDAGAYSRSFPVNQGIVISTDVSVGIKMTSVTPAVRAEVESASGHADFRFRFEVETDADADSDYVQFSTQPVDGQVPTLVVTYLP